MIDSSFNEDKTFNENRVAVKLILETSFSKEIRILLKKGQEMKEHKTPFPIIIHLLEGAIDFGVSNKVNRLTSGDVLTLNGNVPHNLVATKDSMVRLTLSKGDKVERVETVSKN
jgi:quercetin dioxygenase-like cupin family protein